MMTKAFIAIREESGEDWSTLHPTREGCEGQIEENAANSQDDAAWHKKYPVIRIDEIDFDPDEEMI